LRISRASDSRTTFLIGVTFGERGADSSRFVPALDVAAAPLHDVTQRRGAHDLRPDRAMRDQGRIEHVEQRRVRVGVAVMGSRREKQKVAAAARSFSSELPAGHIRLSGTWQGVRAGGEMRLVDDDDVPAVRKDGLSANLEVVDGRNDHVVGGPHRLAGKQSPFQGGEQVSRDDCRVDVEEVVQGVSPLFAEVRRDADQNAASLSPGE
jgi:hypothetical protein